MAGYDPGGKNKRDLGTVVYPKSASYLHLIHKLERAEQASEVPVRELKSFDRNRKNRRIPKY